MQKDFDSWNELKKVTNTQKPRHYNVREVWWCQLGLNVGTEQDGGGNRYLRPCLIIRSFGANACLVVPLTTSTHVHALRVMVGNVDGKIARANLSQLRIIDTRRLVEKISFIEDGIFQNIRKAVRNLF